MIERHPQRPWRPDLLGDLAQKDLDDGGDSRSFDLGGDQTHGLVAHRSSGHEQRDVDPVLHEHAGDLRRGLFDQDLGLGQVSAQ